jgi:flagellar protein FlgJ
MTDSLGSFMQNDLNIARFQKETASLKSLENDLKTTNPARDKKLKEAAQQFESVFIHQLLQTMDKTVQRSDFLRSGQSEDVFRDMFYQEIAKNIASNSSSNFGLGQQVYSQLSKYE